MKTVIFKDKAGEWRWHRIAGNNRIVASSDEGFTRKRDAKRAAAGALNVGSWTDGYTIGHLDGSADALFYASAAVTDLPDPVSLEQLHEWLQDRAHEAQG